MKTAISIEKPLLEETDRIAKKLGLSRSRLISLALANYLRNRRNQEMTEQLNSVYSEQPSAVEQPSGDQRKAKLRSIVKDRW